MYAFGVGAIVDLPNFSVIVAGLDDWNTMHAAELVEERLVADVARIHPKARKLLSAPWLEETRSPFDEWARVGVPVLPFPRWMRCSACNLLASIDSGLFDLRLGYFPDKARYVHEVCPRSKSATAVPARFVVACRNGHIDEFPWREFVHRDSGGECPTGRQRYVMLDVGSGARSTDVIVRCEECKAFGIMTQAFGEGANQVLPRCRGRHAHLRRFDADCSQRMRAMLLGASNSWFAMTRSALSIPTSEDPVKQAVTELWPKLAGSAVPLDAKEKLEVAVAMSPELKRLSAYPLAEVWASIEERREGVPAQADDADLLAPEWRVLTDAHRAPRSRDFQLGHPSPLGGIPGVTEVVPVERIREVVALVGFTRIDGPDSGVADDADQALSAPMARSEITWVPSAEVRGEGIFIRLPEERVAEWEDKVAGKPAMECLREALQTWRTDRGLDAATGWRGARYVLLHTLAHALINELALECGYAAASIRERIYTRDGEMAGVLLYTAAPDAEGTLGGLVSLARPEPFARLLVQTLRNADLCASDPMCASHEPDAHEVVLHAAACHACLFVPETSCEWGNRMLHRSVLTETLARHGIAYPFR
jgi:hypothetical protein